MTLSSLSLRVPAFVQQDTAIVQKITRYNEQMEDAYNKGEPSKVVLLYGEKAKLLGPTGIVADGKKANDHYWHTITDPVNWKLEVYAVSQNLDTILNHPEYKSLKNKPSIQAEVYTDKKFVFQLGKSTLVYKTNGREQTGITNFILIWERGPDGEFKIVLDTYTYL